MISNSKILKELKVLRGLFRINWKLSGWLLFFLFFLSAGGGSRVSARTITDMAGRQVNVPDHIIRVISYDNKTNVLLYPVAGNLMVAKSRSMESPYLKYISKEFLNLREVDTKNAEEIMKLKPDILIVAAFLNNRDDLSRYETFAARINIPLVMVDLELMNLDKTCDFLGRLLGKNTEAKACSDYIRTVYRDVESYTKGKRVPGKAYMANDNDGLRTSPNSSNHAQLFDVMKIPNAARVSPDVKGFALVSMEQILAWNPDYVFCVGKGESGPYRTILKSATWRGITAMKTRRVFFVPTEPYSWFDIPPSVNRVLGLVWFADIFYNQPNEITKRKVKEFYHLFYHYDLSDKEYSGLFIWQ